MRQDDLERGKRADGRVRLVIDDAVSSTVEFPQVWRSEVLFKFNGYQAREFF